MGSSALLRPDSSWARHAPAVETFPEIDGVSPAVARLKRDMWCAARDGVVTVLLTGETGTGKQRIARAIHRTSPRARAPFVVIDCAALPATLAEDALFGHVRGAFTGAIDDRAGPFERADGGTVLLDEVGDVPLELQMKLLRALQSRVVARLGSTREIPFDARVIAATNVDLAAARSRGRFREDLYYRLNVYAIDVPPLRRRGPADIQAIVGTTAAAFAVRRRISVPRVDPAALERLMRHSWPGNVRELENAVERMIVAAAGEPVLTLRHLPGYLREGPRERLPRAGPPGRDEIRDALARHAFRRGRAAAALGLSRHQLYRLMKQHGIERDAGSR